MNFQPPQTPVGAPPRPFWLWPHLLSLDAPLVALVWQAWWERSTGVTLLLAHRLVLFLSVWAIYLADRLADGLGPERPDTMTARHRFFRDARRPLSVVLASVLLAVSAVTLGGGLPAVDVRAGLVLATITAAYFAWVHLGRGTRLEVGGWAKEFAVGSAFAVGTALFTREELTTTGWASVELFGLLCFANCALITRWEASDDMGRFLRPACVAIMLFGGAAALVRANVFFTAPIAFSAGILRILDGPTGRNLRPESRRVLADVALLTPCYWLWQ